MMLRLWTALALLITHKVFHLRGKPLFPMAHAAHLAEVTVPGDSASAVFFQLLVDVLQAGGYTLAGWNGK